MISRDGRMYCKKCGFSREISEDDNLIKTRARTVKEITIVDDAEQAATLPTCQTKCPECGNNTAYWWLRQLRAADESEVRFFRCTACGKTWREYD